MSQAFDEAFQLSQQDPLPDDIIKQLQKLEKEIDISEKDDFEYIYEGVYLRINDKANS